MSGRLASFRGPSTPTSSPARQPKGVPASPSRPVESTYHRKIRALLLEIRSATETWDDLIIFDGVKAARELVDTRTDLDNALKLIPDGQLPRTHLVGPKLATMNRSIAYLDSVILKLRKQFAKMNAAVESMELTLIEASKAKGWQWVQNEPMWLTWSLEKFVTKIPSILPPYHRDLYLHIELVNKLRDHTTSFDDARQYLVSWAEQPSLEDESWEAVWEDLCEVEVDGWKKA